MNKLEQLKAAIGKYNSLSYKYNHMHEALSGCNRDLYFRAYQARTKKEALEEELLPALIAVAEAAKSTNDRWEAKDWDAESTDVHVKKLEEADDNYFVLGKLLLPLTKDTDK